MGRCLCNTKTEKIPTGMGEHWELRSFIVALQMQVISWLHKHMSYIDCSEGSLQLESEPCKLHGWKNAWSPHRDMAREEVRLSKTELNPPLQSIVIQPLCLKHRRLTNYPHTKILTVQLRSPVAKKIPEGEIVLNEPCREEGAVEVHKQEHEAGLHSPGQLPAFCPSVV